MKGKKAYGAYGEQAIILNRITGCLLTENNSGEVFAFDSIQTLEAALTSSQVSYVVSENRQIQKTVSFHKNRYYEYVTVESMDEDKEDQIPNTETSEEGTIEPEEIPDYPSESVPIPYVEASKASIEFEELADEDITDLLSVRTVYFTQKFRRYYEKANVQIKSNIDQILSNFRNLKEEELWEYLKQKNNKPLKGSTHQFDKLYVDNSSGHRLVWCRASDLLLEDDGDSIVIIAYVEDHDKGQSRAGENFDANAELYEAFKQTDRLSAEALDGFENDIPPYLFYKNRFVPQLNEQQKEYMRIDPPLMLQGCAGSGKTQVSVEIFSRLFTKGLDITYLTFTRELVDDVRDKVKFLPALEEFNAAKRILTVSDYFIETLGLARSEITYFDGKSFKNWKSKRYSFKKDNKYKELDDEFVWTYIRGVIKGGAVGESIPDRNRFAVWMKSEGMDEEESNLIYDIYEDYERYRETEKALDDNDLAAMMLESEDTKAKMDTAIVDEVQDLTYVQIKALIHCVKDYQIYLCGDINQRVNPTIINLDKISSMFYYRGKSALRTEYLGSSFRSGQGLVAFLNHLSGLRREYIARQGWEAEMPETSLRGDGDGLWATICDEKNMDLRDVCKIAGEAANCIVIVPDEETQISVIGDNKKLEGRVRTVQEMKGLEYDNVIIYDFLSHKNTVFREIFRKERKKDTFGRLLFNLLYVACTRAKDLLIICESGCDEEIKNLVYQDITIKDSLENVRGFMQLEVDDEGWLKEAKRLEKMQKYDMAKSAYRRIESEDHSSDIRRCELMRDSLQVIDAGIIDDIELTLEINAGELIEAGENECADVLYDYLNQYCDVVYINAIYAKAMTNQHVASEYVTRVVNEEDERKLEKFADSFLPYMTERIESNNNKLKQMNRLGKV